VHSTYMQAKPLGPHLLHLLSFSILVIPTFVCACCLLASPPYPIKETLQIAPASSLHNLPVSIIMAPIDPLQCCYREQVAYKLYSTFREPALYRMALLGDWEKVPSRCVSHPKEATFVHKYAPNDTALHRILRTELGEMSCLDEKG
jgi:hypothetical protein